MTEVPQQGWYTDPADAGRLRYWDGTSWTDQVQEISPPTFSPPAGPPIAPPPFRADAPSGAASPEKVGGDDQIDEVPLRRNRMLIVGLAVAVALVIAGGIAASVISDDADDTDASSVGEPEPDRAPDPAPDPVPDKAALQAAYVEGVRKGCEEAKPEVSAANPRPALDIEWNQDYAVVLGIERGAMVAEIRACLQAHVEAAAAAEAARLAEEAAAAAAAEEAAIAAAGPADVDSIVKNPDAVKGQVFTLVAQITQFDAATGPCNFRGNWDRVAREYNFEYEGDNAMFSSAPTITATADCPIFNGVDQDDTVSVVVRSQGSYSYDTQIGGNTTVPLFQVLRVTNVTKG